MPGSGVLAHVSDEVLLRLRSDPVLFAKLILGVETLTDDQQRFMRAVAEHRYVACTAGHGVGKDHAASCLVWWFALMNPNSRIVTTAPTWEQVESILWREIRAHRDRCLAAGITLGGVLTKSRLDLGAKWFAVGLSTNESHRFQGTHGQRVMVLLDEATGIERIIWDGAESMAVGDHDRIVAIGNPTEPSSRFREVCELESWHHMTISSEDHPNVIEGRDVIPGAVTRGWVEGKLREYGGRDTPEYRARVLGLWPIEFGLYFAKFSRDQTVYRAGSITHPAWYSYIIGCDWGYRHDAAAYIAVSDGESIWIEDELCDNLMEPDELATRIWELGTRTPAGARIDALYLSPDAWGEKQGPRTVASEMRRTFEDLAKTRIEEQGGRTVEIPAPRQAYNSRITGWQVMRACLYDGRLRISDRCPRLLEQIQKATYDPKRAEDLLKGEGDDPLDAARYLVASWLRQPTVPKDELLARATRDLHAQGKYQAAMFQFYKKKAELEHQGQPIQMRASVRDRLRRRR